MLDDEGAPSAFASVHGDTMPADDADYAAAAETPCRPMFASRPRPRPTAASAVIDVQLLPLIAAIC